MVHLGDTASFLRVVRIYVKREELLLRIRGSLRIWSLSYSRLRETRRGTADEKLGVWYGDLVQHPNAHHVHAALGETSREPALNETLSLRGKKTGKIF